MRAVAQMDERGHTGHETNRRGLLLAVENTFKRKNIALCNGESVDRAFDSDSDAREVFHFGRVFLK